MAMKMKLISHVPEAMRAIRAGAMRQMQEAVNEVKNTTIGELSQPGKGRTYTHYFFTDKQGRLRRGRKRNKPHTASAPGSPPARDTSELVQSIAFNIESDNRKIVGRVGTRLKKGTMLEFGTRKMKPRPFLKKSFEKANVKDILGHRWMR